MVAYFSRFDINFSFPTGASGAVVRSFFLADVNGDSRADAVLTYEYYPLQNQALPVRVLLGLGGGAFTDDSASAFAAGAPAFVDARSAAVADFNGDGRADILLGDTGFESRPYAGGHNGLLLSGPGGLVDASANLPAFQDYTGGVSAGDVNGDGKPDALVTTLGSRGPYLLINDGTGHFTVDRAAFPATVGDPANGQYPTGLLFDADNDGRADLYLGGDGDSKILLNDGAGHFVTPSGMTYPIASLHNVVDAVAADVNGDGRLDVVETVALDNFSRGEIRILVNQGAGIFADLTGQMIAGSPVLTEDTGWIYETQVADFNGDGAPDLLLSGGARSVLLINDGSGNFARLPGLPALGGLDRAAAADLNGDGRADLLVRTADQGGVEHLTVYLSQPISTVQTAGPSGEGMMGGPGADAMTGGAGDDVLEGGGGDDNLRGFEANDLVFGGLGNDTVNGNTGNDTVHGGFGRDEVYGGVGDDIVFGDEGDDNINGNRGDDFVYGGAGADTVHGGQANDQIFGGYGNDLLNGDLGDDTMTGGPGADIFHASAGTDRVTDFSLAEGDRVMVAPGSVYTVSQVGADTVIAFADGAQLTLAGVASAGLTNGWILEG